MKKFLRCQPWRKGVPVKSVFFISDAHENEEDFLYVTLNKGEVITHLARVSVGSYYPRFISALVGGKNGCHEQGGLVVLHISLSNRL